MRLARTPTWLDVGGRPCLAWWHTPPDAMVRGGVVLVPAVGSEQTATHRAVRLLADQLAAAGMGALRLDPPGTGDSAGGIGDDGVIDSWPPAAIAGVRWVREAGAQDVVLAGLRLGATVAAAAATSLAGADGEDAAAGLVMWDPCSDGRTFLRRERLVHRLSLPHDTDATDDGGVVANGLVYPPGAVAALRRLVLPDPGTTGAGPVLLLVRPEDREAPWARAWSARPGAELVAVQGQPELVEREPNTAAVPVGTLEQVVAWVGRALPAERREVRGRVVPEAVVGHGPCGEVRERVEVAADGAVAVITTPQRERGAAVAFTHAASVHHVGPARHWVRLARTWADEGYRCVRVDDPDLGDGMAVELAVVPHWYTPERLAGVRRAAALARDGADVPLAMVGLCAGAWGIVRTAQDVRPDAVLLVNPLTWDPDQPPQDAAVMLGHEGDLPWVERHPSVWRAGRTLKRVMGRLGLWAGPDAPVAAPPRRGVAVPLVVGDTEHELYRRFGRAATRREVAASPLVREIHLHLDDHTLQGAGAARVLDEVLTAALLADLPGRG